MPKKTLTALKYQVTTKWTTLKHMPAIEVRIVNLISGETQTEIFSIASSVVPEFAARVKPIVETETDEDVTSSEAEQSVLPVEKTEEGDNL